VTAAELLSWIAAALFLQIAAGISVVLRRRHGVASSAVSIPAQQSTSSRAAWIGWRDFRIQRRDYEDEARSQCSFYLEPVDGAPLPPFKPGQFLTISFEVADKSANINQIARPVTRCYSLSDRPDPAAYRITIKRVSSPPGRPEIPPGVSSNYFHDHVHPGDLVRVKAPAGHFFIDPDPSVPVALVAAGIGITPLMSMLSWCMADQPGRRVHLVYGVRNGRDHAFREVLQRMAASNPRFGLTVAYSRPESRDAQGQDFQHVGHVDVELLKRLLPHGRHQFYVCGPAAMMQSLVPALADWGVPREDLHFEAFGPASVKLPGIDMAPPGAEVSATFEIRFNRSGRTLVWDGECGNLLEFAELHGVKVDSGCRSGGCGSCETRLSSGAVRYDSPPDHDIAPGHCLLCVGRPSSALVLEA
jgi:ferredoxin-NADP reductase